MLHFSKLELNDIDKLRPYFLNCKSRICDRTVGACIMWRDYFSTHYALTDQALYLKVVHYGGETAITAPVGSNAPEDYEQIINYCENSGIQPVLCMVPENRMDMIHKLYPNAQIETKDIWSDYLYDAQSMVTFAGRKLSGQRNHCNKFMKLYPQWSFERIDTSNVMQVREFAQVFITEHRKDSPTLLEADKKIIEILDNYSLYGMCAGVLKVDGKIIGMSIAEVLGDTLFIHIEKCLREFEGSYPMLVRCFANEFVTENIKYINREEDDGDPGLRISKRSYHPIAMLNKYTVRI